MHKERGGITPDKLDSFAHRFTQFDIPEPEAIIKIEELQRENPTISKAEIFRQITQNKGTPSTHASAFQAEHQQNKLKRS